MEVLADASEGGCVLNEVRFSKGGHQFLFIRREKLGVGVTVEALSLHLKINKSSNLLLPAKDHKFILFKHVFEQKEVSLWGFFSC